MGIVNMIDIAKEFEKLLVLDRHKEQIESDIQDIEGKIHEFGRDIFKVWCQERNIFTGTMVYNGCYVNLDQTSLIVGYNHLQNQRQFQIPIVFLNSENDLRQYVRRNKW